MVSPLKCCTGGLIATKEVQVEAGVPGGDSRKAEQRQERSKGSMCVVKRCNREKVCGCLLVNKKKQKQRAEL